MKPSSGHAVYLRLLDVRRLVRRAVRRAVLRRAGIVSPPLRDWTRLQGGSSLCILLFPKLIGSKYEMAIQKPI